MHRMGKYVGLRGIAPFADVRLMEYVWNIPWNLKRKNGVVKYVLREAARGLLPDEVLFRKKSPFPKTYDPTYTALLAERLHDVLSDATSPVRTLLDIQKAQQFLTQMRQDPNLSRPWFGQLMAGPQMMAYILQMDYWLRQYNVRITP
jgi:asparagine synthase (glutamine-hydrolysing)